MVTYADAFEVSFALHLAERKSADLDAMFNDAEDMESNMRASGRQLKTRYDPPERIEYPNRRRGKEPEASPAGQEPMSMEEVAKRLRSITIALYHL